MTTAAGAAAEGPRKAAEGIGRRQAAASALRLLREPDWARAAAGVLLLSLVFLLLGRWQWHRHLAAVALSHRVAVNYSAAPVPVTDLLRSTVSPFPAAAEWRQVLVHGRYQPNGTVLVRNRPLDGNFGYEVVVPLRIDSGAVLLIDRGWLPEGATAARPDRVPAPPVGAVDVIARLRPSEPPTTRRPPPGQALRIDAGQIGASLNGGRPDARVYQAYGVLAHEQQAPPVTPTLLPRPTVELGPHLAYAVQWWLFAVTAYVLLGMNALREVRRRAGDPSGTTESARVRRPRDEEVEDAALDALSSPPPPR